MLSIFFGLLEIAPTAQLSGYEVYLLTARSRVRHPPPNVLPSHFSCLTDTTEIRFRGRIRIPAGKAKGATTNLTLHFARRRRPSCMKTTGIQSQSTFCTIARVRRDERQECLTSALMSEKCARDQPYKQSLKAMAKCRFFFLVARGRNTYSGIYIINRAAHWQPQSVDTILTVSATSILNCISPPGLSEASPPLSSWTSSSYGFQVEIWRVSWTCA